jgi:Kdo2-lipid IVA lauroyltransferase/acyltransferase
VPAVPGTHPPLYFDADAFPHASAMNPHAEPAGPGAGTPTGATTGTPGGPPAGSPAGRNDRAARGPREPLWQRVLAAIASGLLTLVGLLPQFLAYGLADLLAVPWALYWACTDRRGRRSKGYWHNVRLCFRPGSPLGPYPRGHLWRWSRHMSWLAVDFCRMHRINERNLEHHCDLGSYHRIEAMVDKGKGLIFATAHVGMWDVAGYTAGLLGLGITSVYRPSPFPALDRVIARMRTGSGQTVVAKQNVLWTLKKVLAQHGVTGLLVDSGAKGSQVYTPFLGVLAATVATPALLHLATGAPIAVVTVARTGRMRFRLHVWDLIEHAPTGDRQQDLQCITARINRGITQAIRAEPEQWFWHGRRFRHRPPGEVPGADGLPPLVADGDADLRGADAGCGDARREDQGPAGESLESDM